MALTSVKLIQARHLWNASLIKEDYATAKVKLTEAHKAFAGWNVNDTGSIDATLAAYLLQAGIAQ